MALDGVIKNGGNGLWMKNLVGASSALSLGALFTNPAVLKDSVKLFFFGSIIETGRRCFQWLFNRIRLRTCPVESRPNSNSRSYSQATP